MSREQRTAHFDATGEMATNEVVFAWHRARARDAVHHPSLKWSVIYSRLCRGWSADRAVSTPMQPQQGRRPGNRWNEFRL